MVSSADMGLRPPLSVRRILFEKERRGKEEVCRNTKEGRNFVVSIVDSGKKPG